MSHTQGDPILEVLGLAYGYDGEALQHDVSFDVKRGSIFAIMGASGSGKSTLLKALIGLLRPSAGQIVFGGVDYCSLADAERAEIGRHFGVLFQGGALWSSMTAAENVALPLEMFTDLDRPSIEALVQLKLSLVGLDTGRDRMPSDLSGGMRQRVGLARALALDPQILFLDEPSTGLDPISARHFDDLVKGLRDGFGVTVVMVSHELPSLFGICDDGVFLDAEMRTAIAHGAPQLLRDECRHPTVQAFMHREAIPSHLEPRPRMMRNRPVIVGSFILGALALGVIAILAFGGMSLFTHKLRVVVVFSDSIAGLEVGAPVTFRGVRIGRVEGMRLHIDVHRQASWLPVYLDLDLDRIAWADGSVGGSRADLQAAVDSGLRAQLVSQGLLGGEMTVNLDYRPGTPARLAGRAEDAFEIPTVPSDLQDLKAQLLELDLPEIGHKAREALTSVQRVTDELGTRIGPLADGLQTTLATATDAIHQLQVDSAHTLADVDRLANESRRQIATNGNDLDQVLKNAEQATMGADQFVASLNDMTSPRGDLQASLRDLAASSNSLRGLTHDLERNPLRTLLRRSK